MAVPYTFGTATSSIPLSQLDSNFNTVITLGNTAIQLGNTVTTLNNMTLANVTISSGNVTITNVAITTANVTTANITTAVIGTETVTTSTITSANITTANVTTANITTGNIATGNVSTSLTLSYGTANAVTYLNGSKVLTSGSALTFDGTNFATTGTATATKLIPTGSSATGNGLYLPAANSVGISTNGTNAVYIDSSQNVGIGTSLPIQKLDVNNVIFARPSTTAGSGELIAAASDYSSLPSFTNTALRQYGSTATGTFYGITKASLGVLEFVNVSTGLIGSNGAAIAFATSSTERMRIDSSGNVGIGTPSPNSLLDLTGNDPTLRFTDNAGSPTATFSLRSTDANFKIRDVTNGSDRITIDSSGIITMSAYGSGAATFSASGVISSVSDETWKIKDGVPVDPDAMLKKLEPGYWYYNDEKKETFGVDRQLGFYAQNVNAAIGPEAAPTPETVISKAEDGTDIVTTKPWGYYDRSVLAVTVMSLQKALATIESLTARIEALER